MFVTPVCLFSFRASWRDACLYYRSQDTKVIQSAYARSVLFTCMCTNYVLLSKNALF